MARQPGTTTTSSTTGDTPLLHTILPRKQIFIITLFLTYKVILLGVV